MIMRDVQELHKFSVNVRSYDVAKLKNSKVSWLKKKRTDVYTVHYTAWWSGKGMLSVCGSYQDPRYINETCP